MNIDPNSQSVVVPENMFTSAQLSTASHNESYLVAVVQQHSTWNQGDGTSAGTRYHTDWRHGYFNSVYTNQAVKTNKILEQLEESPENINKRSITRILRAYQFHRLTDLYGDVPYSEAGEALEQNYSPVFDTQEFIYTDMLEELNEAAQALSASQPSFGSGDLFYGGDIEQWRKFAYSLMLRLGMRLTEVSPGDAETWVETAIAGGVILTNEDIPYIMYENGRAADRNPRAQSIIDSNYGTPQDEFNFLGGKIAKTFIDHLQDTNDPRLEALTVVWVEQGDGSYAYDNSPELQRGMEQTWTAYPPEFGEYSEPHPETLLRYDSPMFFFTAEESNLLLAEAAIRGWYTAETAEEAYNRAVREGMDRWSLYGDGYSANILTESRVDEYLTENPFLTGGSFEEQLDQISTQKWASLYHTDEYEQWSNWRRTGYPELQGVNVPGNHTGGEIPRRMVVPEDEQRFNRENYEAAVQRQGGPSWNNLLGRVWWDVED
ncbi:MAG: SusD/RagB family nutrient-binding outer membrane lipoprotein [Balneolaceae bacterium]